MGCCNKNAEKLVTPDVLRNRRDECKKCKHFDKNPHPKFARFGGLTNVSKCKKVNKTVANITKNPKFKCPIGKFKAI